MPWSVDDLKKYKEKNTTAEPAQNQTNQKWTVQSLKDYRNPEIQQKKAESKAMQAFKGEEQSLYAQQSAEIKPQNLLGKVADFYKGFYGGIYNTAKDIMSNPVKRQLAANQASLLPIPGASLLPSLNVATTVLDAPVIGGKSVSELTDRPQQALFTGAQSYLEPIYQNPTNLSNYNPITAAQRYGQGFMEGLTGQKKTTTLEALLPDQAAKSVQNVPVLGDALNFIGGAALDPFNLVGAGMIKPVQKAGIKLKNAFTGNKFDDLLSAVQRNNAPVRKPVMPENPATLTDAALTPKTVQTQPKQKQTFEMTQKEFDDFYDLDAPIKTPQEANARTIRLTEDIGNRIQNKLQTNDIPSIVEFYRTKNNLPPVKVNWVSGTTKKGGIKPIRDGNGNIERFNIWLDPNSSDAMKIGTLRHEIEHAVDLMNKFDAVENSPKLRNTLRESMMEARKGTNQNYGWFEPEYLRRAIIKDALESGQKVPDNVLKDFPDLFGPMPAKKPVPQGMKQTQTVQQSSAPSQPKPMQNQPNQIPQAKSKVESTGQQIKAERKYTEQQQEALDKLEANRKRDLDSLRMTKDPLMKQKQQRSIGERYDAKRREIIQGDSLTPVDGGLAQGELKKKLDRLRSNYIGKEVITPDGEGKVKGGTPAGDVRVEFPDGSVKTFKRDQVTAKFDVDAEIAKQKAAQQEVKQPEPVAKPEPVTAKVDVDDLNSRTFDNVWQRNVKAYQYENPEVKPYFQSYADYILRNEFNKPGAKGYGGNAEFQKGDVTKKLRETGLKYNEIQKGLEAIIKDEGAENIAAAKKVELVLDDLLSKGFTTLKGDRWEPDADYLKLTGKNAPKENELPLPKQYNAQPKASAPVAKQPPPEPPKPKAEEAPTPGQKESRFKTVTTQEATAVTDDFKEYAKGKEKYYDTSVNADEWQKAVNRVADDTDGIEREFLVKKELSGAEDTADGMALFEKYQKEAMEATDEATKTKLFEKANTVVDHLSELLSKAGQSIQIASLFKRMTPDGMVNFASRQAKKAAKEAGVDTKQLKTLRETIAKLEKETAKPENKLNFELFDELKKAKTELDKLQSKIDKLGHEGNISPEKQRIIAEKMKVYTDNTKIDELVAKITNEKDSAKVKPMMKELKALYKAQNSAIDDVFGIVADLSPATLREKYEAFRRMSMLSNTLTHIKNIIGNVPMATNRKVADFFGFMGEKLLRVPKDQRTKSIGGIFDKDIRKAVDLDWAKEKYNLMRNGRFDIEAKGFQSQYRTVFKTEALNKVNDLVKAGLNVGDYPFLRAAYKDAMRNFMKSRGLKEVTKEAREYASRRAFEATYKQMNDLATWIRQAKTNQKNTLGGKALSVAVESAVPFTLTPTNILYRALEYSPAGFIKAIVSAGGKKGAPQVIEDFSKALTGSALTYLGFQLASMGLAKGSAEKSKKAESIEGLEGKQPYSINTPWGNVNLDWVQPSAMPFFAGVEFFDKMVNDKEGGVVAAYNAVIAGADTIIRQSVLKNLSDTLGGGGKSPAEALAELPLDYIEQAIPSVLGAVNRSFVDTTKREIKDKDSDNIVSNMVRSGMSRIPIASQMLEPKVDVLGRDVKQNPWQENLLIPWKTKTKEDNRIVDEMTRVRDSLQNINKINPKNVKDVSTTDMLPSTEPPKNSKGEPAISYTDKKNVTLEIPLTSKDITEYKKEYGKQVTTLMNNLLDNKYKDPDKKKSKSIKYSSAKDDIAKAKFISQALKQATQNAKLEILKKKGIDPKIETGGAPTEMIVEKGYKKPKR